MKDWEMAEAKIWKGTQRKIGSVRSAAALAAVIALFAIVSTPSSARAQATADRSAVGDRSDPGFDADEARTDAILGGNNYNNLYATAPGAQQQAVRPQIRLNGLVPLNFDSNPLELGSGSPSSWGTFPVVDLSAAAPLGDLPLRLSVSARSQFKRFSDTPDANVDRLTFSGRVQYVDPNNDQAFSPYFAITPRFSYLPTFSDQTEARQDFNLGFSKSFHFDGSLQPVPVAADTSAETVWSFGLTAFVQRRLRQPQLSSDAVGLIPSVRWTISRDWNASFGIELLGRWYEPDRFGHTSRDWEVLPIVTLEYVIPASLFGSENAAKMLGRPAIDLQGSRLEVWSTVPGVSFNQWEASATLKVGWRF